jgi:hypothetical protein
VAGVDEEDEEGDGEGGGKTVLAVLLEEISSGIYVNI